MAPKKAEEKGSTFVFVMDPDYGWRPAILEDTIGDTAVVSIPEYKDEQSMQCDGGRGAKLGDKQRINLKNYPHGVLPLQNVDGMGNLLEFSDMVRLPYLHEAAILYNMKKRHMDGKPYTRTGDIVIAVNPFQWFKDLYTEKKRTYYANKLVWESHEDDPRGDMEPHVYEVSSLCYKGLAFEQTDQSILVSGESGAGKTETVKICMNHMASVQVGPRTALEGDSQELDPVVKRVVESNPLLETYGNAKTKRNDNSSRFGKYLQLQFDNSEQRPGMIDRSKSTCVLAGSKCDVYLLEKNRVCVHGDGERSYHCFYQVLAAPPDEKKRIWKGIVGKKNEDFKYVGHCDPIKIEDMTDEEHYHNTKRILNMVKVDDESFDTLMRAICIVMQCGNLTFGAKGGDKDQSAITSKSEVDALAELMGVKPEELGLSFTERTMKTKTETYKVPLNPNSAKEAADAFAKECYGKIFIWVVSKVNVATNAQKNYKNGSMAGFKFGIIGLLDIFGFESFQVNRFSQLCINYANEKLQQKFTEDVFRSVQLEYEAEGIELAEIKFDDNTDVLDLIEGRGGLLALLNEECVRPKGSDQDFVQKAIASNKDSPCLIVNKMDRMSFGIHHFAGKVMYDADGFLTSNTDTLPTDLEELGERSANEIISKKIEEEKKDDAPAGDGGGRVAPKRQKSNLVAPTVWGKYKTMLGELMGNLRKTNSRYIRCVKPNMAKKPLLMEHVATVEQLRCAGVVAAVTLARSAFPNRLDNPSVMFRYKGMWDKKEFPSKKNDSMTKEEQQRCDCDAVLGSALKSKETLNKEGKTVKAYVVGKTKSYFRAGALEYLEANRSTGLDAQAVTIQKMVRGMLARKKVGEMVGAAQRREREAREARERAEREAKEAEAREKAQRESARQGEARKLDDQIDFLKKQLQEVEEHEQERIKDAKERKDQIEALLEQLREDTGEEARKALLEPKKIAAVQKKKLAEQTKQIEFLKKENKKVRKENDKIREKWEVVKKNNEKLLKSSEAAGDDFDQKEETMNKVDQRNADLVTTLEKSKTDNKRLKDECMQKQDLYMAQAETRLEYQKTMARVLNLIQDKLKDPQIMEDTVNLALECESEAKQIMAALEAETELDM